MRHLDLYSGIGGLALGLKMAGGFETVAFCERDEWCRQILNKNFPDVTIYEDVRTIETDRLGRIDIITGGFPCQPFSVAGRRRGAEDDRYLWPETLTIIDALRPAWFIGENVAGLVSMGITERISRMEGGRTERNPEDDLHEEVLVRQEKMLLNSICEDLEKIGYQVQPFVVPACAVDAPHRRDRVWIVANASRLQSGRQEPRPERERARSGGQSDPMANAKAITERARLCATGSGGVGRGRSVNCSDAGHGADSYSYNAQGIKSGGTYSQEWQRQEQRPARSLHSVSGRVWEPEPGLGRVAHGIPRRVDRLKGLGNAVVPEVVERFALAINRSSI